MKQIITIPHETLRKKAKEVTVVDKKLTTFIKDLEKTLQTKRNPRGVGLAAPQVDQSIRLFCININKMTPYINPIITQHSTKLTFGPDEDDPIMEGCLSMPELYGPVPRYEWVDIEYKKIINQELVSVESRIFAFEARVFQHELDHLNGILFTDYSLQFDLPVYKETNRGKYEEVDPELLKLF